MEVIEQKPALDETENSFFKTKDGNIPLWDHPLLKGSKVLPTKYYPYTSSEEVLTLYKRGILNETDFRILKVLGDAVCANEDQLRRYMELCDISRSDTSKRLDKYRKNGLVDRWKVRIRGDEESVKPPAPFTLGVAGYKVLKHFYNDQSFVHPDRWDTYGIGGIKRYVAMNELRCLMVESKLAKRWKWNAILADDNKIKFPLAAAEVKTPQGNINFLIDRAQQNQDFIGYFAPKLEAWKKVYEKHGNLPVGEFSPTNMSVVIIYTATLSIAEHIHNELMLDTFPFQTWVCVEEDLLKDGFHSAFYIPNKEKLKRIKLEL